VKHEREQAQRLRLLRQQVGHEPGQKDRFLGEIAADDIGAARVVPPLRERGIDGVQNGVEAAGKLLALRDAQWNAGLSYLVLGTHESLAHAAGEVRNAEAIDSRALLRHRDGWRRVRNYSGILSF
jgi:hypothetical protein